MLKQIKRSEGAEQDSAPLFGLYAYWKGEDKMYNKILKQVREIVLEAAEIIDSMEKIQIKEKGINDFVTTCDIKISNFLCDRLPKILENSRVISEEGNIVAPEKGYYWIVDPIDGTSNFIYGIPEHAISVGLVKDGMPVLGVVYAPKKNEMYYAAKGEGAFCNGSSIHVCSDQSISSTIVLAETNPYSSRPENAFSAVFQELFKDCIDYRITGSAALDCCYIARGRGGVFVSEKLKPWDYAAGVILIQEAGGEITQWNGEALGYFGSSTILATNGQIHEEAVRRIKSALSK